MRNRIPAAVCALAVTASVLTARVQAFDAEILPVCDGITLLDTSGYIYIHMQGEGSLTVTVDKTEPEGIFRYYSTELAGASSGSERIYKMELSCCEYLVDSGEYASVYTAEITVPNIAGAGYSQSVLIKDPGFEDIVSSEYHFYVTTEPASELGYRIIGGNESVTDEGVYVCDQYIVIQYEEKLTGDTDGDGKVTISDAAAVLEYYAVSSAGLETELDATDADTDGDGVVEIADAAYILSYYAMNAAGMNPVWDDIFR